MATTITVKDATLERFNRLKSAHNEPGVPEMNADLFLNSLMDTLEAVDDGYYDEGTTDKIEVVSAEEFRKGMDNGESINEAALAEAVADYLINGENLPDRIAEELQR